LQTWCDLLNIFISHAPPTPDELVDASPLHYRCNVSSTPHPHAIFEPPQPSYSLRYHYPPYQYHPPPVGGSSGGNALPSYPCPHLHHIHILRLQLVLRRVIVLLHHIHTLLPQLVLRQVVMLLHHVRTHHPHQIHTLHLNMFTLEVVTTRVEGTHPIGQDRAKAATQKEKGKEGSSSQSKSYFVVNDIMSNLKKLSTSFTKS
jgi:hypothetical protein